MISLSGLAQTYPGYAAQEEQTAKTAKTHEDTQLQATKARDAAIKAIGQTVAGAALAGNGPQAPAPGQPSVPNQPPGPPAAIPPQGAPPVPPGGPPQGVPPPQPPASVPPAAGGAPVSFKMGLQPAIAQILKTTPNVANHPEVLLSALNHFKDLGVLDPDAEAKLDEASSQHTLQRVAAARGHLKAVQAASGKPAEPEEPEPPAAAALPTATDPKTGAKVQWDGKAWQPIT